MGDSLTVSKGNRVNNIQISSKSKFFEEPIVYTVEDGCIFLRRTTIDDYKNIINPTLDKKSNFYKFYIKIDDVIEYKRYEFDEDSNDDEVIIYYH